MRNEATQVNTSSRSLMMHALGKCWSSVLVPSATICCAPCLHTVLSRIRDCPSSQLRLSTTCPKRQLGVWGICKKRRTCWIIVGSWDVHHGRNCVKGHDQVRMRLPGGRTVGSISRQRPPALTLWSRMCRSLERLTHLH